MVDAINSSKLPKEVPIQEIKDFPFVIVTNWDVEEPPRFATKALAKEYLESQGNVYTQYICKVVSRVKGVRPPVTLEEETV